MMTPSSMNVTLPSDIAFPDLAVLMPVVAVCVASIVFTTLWLLVVSRHTHKCPIRR